MSVLRIAQITLTVLAVALVAWIVDWPAFLATLARADIVLVLATFVLSFAQRVLMAGKWAVLMRVHGIRLGLVDSWSIYSFASLMATALPSSVGGDAVRVAWLWRRGIDAHQAASSVVIEKVIGAAIGFGFAAIGIVLLGHEVAAARALDAYLPVVLGVLVLIGGVLIAALFHDPRWLGRIPVLRKAAPLVEKFRAALQRYRSRGDILATFTGLTLLENVWTFAVGWVSALSIGLDIGFVQFASALAVALVVTRLPISIDGIGVLEGSFVLVLGLLGVSPTEAVALALLGRVILIASYVPGAVWLGLRGEAVASGSVAVATNSDRG